MKTWQHLYNLLRTYIRPFNTKAQFIPSILLQKFYGLQNGEDFEKRWQQLSRKYTHIILYRLPSDAIGEVIARYFIIENDKCADSVLRVFIPDVGNPERICNKELLKLLGQKIYIVQEDDVVFWLYVFSKYSKKIDKTQFDKYTLRGNAPTYKWKTYDCNFKLKLAERKNFAAQVKQMGLHRPYVCVAARTAIYNKKTLGNDFDYSYRNMDFTDYSKAIGYLHKKYDVVRIGRSEKPIVLEEQFIDYAGYYANDFMDLYLISNCKFLMVGVSGIGALGTLFSKPILMVNVVPFTFGAGGLRYTEYDLFIPKKYYDIGTKRFLSIREIINLESKCLIFGKRYKQNKIKFINNTPEEIEAACKEMNERLEGVWKDTPEDIENYKQYLRLYNKMQIEAANNTQNWLGGPLPYRIAASYLRNHKYLLK